MSGTLWTRREALVRLGWAGMLAGIAGLAAAAARFMSPPVELQPTLLAEAGKPDTVATGQPLYLAANRTWILRDAAGVYAVSALCPHLGCTVAWEGGTFACPCHGSAFDSGGGVLKGPAARPLARVWVGLSAAGGMVVDRGRTVPASFRLAA